MTKFKGIGAAALLISALMLLALAGSCNKSAAAQGKGNLQTQTVSADTTQKVAADGASAEAGEAGECANCPGCAGKDKSATDAAAAGDEKPAVENTATAGETKGDCQGCADCKETGSCGGDCAGKGCENADKKAGECGGGSCEGCPGKDSAGTEEKKETENTSTV